MFFFLFSRKKAENYREITLMDTGYKILTMTIEERLRKETERLDILPETQVDFKKKRSYICIDNIYILKTAVESKIKDHRKHIRGNNMQNQNERQVYEKILNNKRTHRQGCPLSLLLFLILIADIEEFLKKRGNGGVTIEKRRFYTLAYADDLAVLATKENELKRMLKSLEKYFEEREMILNVEKSKVLMFSRKDINKRERQ